MVEVCRVLHTIYTGICMGLCDIPKGSHEQINSENGVTFSKYSLGHAIVTNKNYCDFSEKDRIGKIVLT